MPVIAYSGPEYRDGLPRYKVRVDGELIAEVRRTITNLSWIASPIPAGRRHGYGDTRKEAMSNLLAAMA